MKSKGFLFLSIVIGLAVLLAACASGGTPTASPTAKPTSPTASPTAQPTSPTASPTATSKPTATSPTATAKPTATVPAATAKPTSAVSFAGKTITLVVPVAAGGGTDIITRVYARYLPKYLPGNPTIIVANKPGSGSTIGGNYIMQSKPDGMNVLVSTSSARFAYAFGSSAAKYDMSKMPTALAMITGNGLYTSPKLISKPEDIVNVKGLKFGHTAGSVSYSFAMFREMVGFPVDAFATAYGGDSDAIRAFLSGEINTSGAGLPSFMSNIVPLIEKGEALALFQGGNIDENGNIFRAPVASNVPTGGEVYESIFNKPPSGQAWDAYKMVITIAAGYDKVIHLHPDTPPEIVKAWWDASDKLANDKEFLQVLEPLAGETPQLISGERCNREFKANISKAVVPELVKYFKDVMAANYKVVIS